MSKLSHLNALFQKNMKIMRRKCCNTVCEIIFPIILMILVILLRKAFKLNKYYYSDTTDTDYFASNSSALTSQESFYSFTKRNVLSICNSRPTIGIIGTSFPESLLQKIQTQIVIENSEISFKNFDTAEDIDNYVENELYSANSDYPPICFGIAFNHIESSNTYNISLHYFGTNLGNGIKDIPSTLVDNVDEFQNGPDMDSYERYSKSGYFYIMKMIYDTILQIETGDQNAEINFGIMAQKYVMYQDDTFGRFIGFILPFFLVIAYLIPLSMQVSRMVGEKESKAKEGMKIMGLTESIYFLSYFLQFFIQNTIYAIVNSAIMTQVFDDTGYIYLFAFFWLYGINIFALSFFFQSMMDKTRLAMIVSILLYFIMYFVSIAVISDEVKNAPKMLLSLLPPTALQLGVNTMAQFDSNAITFDSSCVGKKYNNYSVGNMYLMFVVDFFIYLFLGYYLQNIISHEFGISRPVYFLCTKDYWGCGNKKKSSSEVIKKVEMQQNNNNNNDSTPQYLNMKSSNNPHNLGLDNDNRNINDEGYFQNEVLYADKTGAKDVLKIINLRKEFSDGKVAVNNVSFNLYKDEIFALLGHNGAGKTTTISMLTGLYTATSGRAEYDNMNILSNTNMDIFRTKLGICPQHDVLFDDLSVEEHLSMFCVFKGVPSSKIQNEISKSLRDFDLEDKRSVRAVDLSAGQRRKLSIAIAIIGGSEVIFLDEPSSGMDITSRRALWDILKEVMRGKIIVLTTHYMEEAAVLGQRIGIISNGEMKCIGTPLFLIEKFGKYISVTIVKESNADNNSIIDFFEKEIGEVKVEVLSEEILFRIPKNNNKNFSMGTFFSKLDENVQQLKIKTYSASMPTLEDVFLNVSSMERNKNEMNKLSKKSMSNISINVENDKILFDDNNYNISRTPLQKITIDLSVSLKKRCYQIIRDTKSFLLEVLCPIILVLIGLGVSSVEFNTDNAHFLVEPSALIDQQIIYYGNQMSNSEASIPSLFITDDNSNLTFTSISIENKDNITASMISFMNSLITLNPNSEAKFTNSFGAYYFIDIDKSIHKYEFATFVNLISRQSAIVYPSYMLNKIVHYATGKSNDELKITFYNCPFQKTYKEQSDSAERTNSTLVFFVAVAFALIPANFITIIIKERENNTKHLQIISGISLISYWGSNFIFELVKYYFTGGICLVIIALFDFFPKNFYALYILYGPSMVSFTYLFSFIFNNEHSAQNSVILLNFLFGALGGSVILILRLMEDVTDIGKGLAFIFRIVPSFCFCYGFNELLSSYSLFYIDYPDTWMTKSENDMTKLKYVGMDLLFMGIETLLYGLLIVVFEKRASGAICNSDNEEEELIREDREDDAKSVNDSQVLKEVARVNEVSKNEGDEDTKFSIKVRNLSKKYSKGMCTGNSKSVKAVKNISFCIEYGECFGLLGINGAGKTTTFKCLTNEILATNGRILINNKEIRTHFTEVRSLIGYCPQFDAIFEYMTVYENLVFYAKIKGIVEDKIEEVITALMNEMNLAQYKNKISGQLSGGNKRKLSVSIAMICNPPIVFLDEPSTGMDPEARRFMWSVIHKISTRSKRSSVIMTTHSMDEAETLCRRIGILVNGQFACMGSSTYIKDKYGDGYEINLQIAPLSEKRMENLLTRLHINEVKDIQTKDVISFLNSINKSNLTKEIDKGIKGLGHKLMKEISMRGRVPCTKIISWCYYIESALKVVDKVKKHFPDVILSENVENSFLFKVKKGEGKKSIGFLFGIVEEAKDECHIEEYSIQQTSLEQIFNKFTNDNKIFEKRSNDEEVEEDIKVEIDITQDLIDNVLFTKKCL